MADTPLIIYEGQPGTTDTLLYTNNTSFRTVVKNVHVCNTTGLAATITLGLNSGGTLGTTTHFYSAFSVGANSIDDRNTWSVINISGTIRALQGTASALTVTISGVETT